MRPLFFMWIPKTGGTVVHNAIKGWFSNPYEGNWAAGTGYPAHDYYVGHVPYCNAEYIPNNPYKITVLRDPIERVISYYNYHHEHGFVGQTLYSDFIKDVDFAGWMRSRYARYAANNQQTRFFSAEQEQPDIRTALEALSVFDVVGIMESQTYGLQSVIDSVAELYSKTAPDDIAPMNASTKYVTYDMLSSGVQIELHQRNQLDIQLYERAVDMCWERVAV